MSKILIIDDEESIRVLLKLSLTSKGYDVITAEDGEKGVEVFERESPPLVLTDIKMPGMDGIAVLRRIKEISPETEVIVITAHGDMESAIQALQLDASDFIVKPLKDEVLSVALKRAQERLDARSMAKHADILEHKVLAATKEISERYEFEGKLIHHSIDGIIATDKKGEIITFNQGAERIFGCSKDEVMGKMDIRSLYPPGIAEEIRHSLYADNSTSTMNSVMTAISFAEAGEPEAAGKERKREGMHYWQETETFVLGKGGRKIPVRFSGTLMYRDGEVIGSVGFFHDLREIKQLQQALINSERLAAIGQTVAGLAHCIKNIVTALEGGVYVVNKALKKGDMSKLHTGWDMVERNIGKTSDLVLDLLSYSKERRPEYKSFSPNVIADEVCELMDSQAKESGIEIVRDLDPAMGEVSLEPKGIHRCLLNLVSNAIDACMSDEDEGKRRMVHVTTKREKDGAVTFQVSDNGCGMDEEMRLQIFRTFFSTKGAKGTGLGLLITQKIVQEHGGTIRVDSQLGKGSTFTIQLPGEALLQTDEQS
jgi:signal transduction histidine kinase/FixJ family two-component response regulator